MDEYAPDHSTISRFRDELLKDKLKEEIFLELERQFDNMGIRKHNERVKIKDGLMSKGCYRRKLTEREKSRNKLLSRYRSSVERVFGTLKRSYGYTRNSVNPI
ncbi:MAG: transposase [Nitrospirae bacterium]|nr:transposase [Nitrospirota bacterium]